MTTPKTHLKPILKLAYCSKFESMITKKVVFQVFDVSYGNIHHSGSGGCLIAEAINQTQGDRIAKALNEQALKHESEG